MGRQISECLPAWLVSRIEEIEARAGSGAAITALRPGPHSHRDETAAVFGIVATAHLSGGEENSRLRASREGTAAQTEFGKRTGANPGKFNREEVKLRSAAQWASITQTLWTIHRNKHVAPPTRYAPALATCLFLVIDRADHATVSGAR